MSLVNRPRKLEAAFVGDIMRNEGLEHVITKESLKGSQDKRKEREQIMDSLLARMEEKTTSLSHKQGLQGKDMINSGACLFVCFIS